jgi:hypothetical protein
VAASEWILAGILSAWLLISVAGQINVSEPHSVFQRVRQWDLFGLIPIWTFFAPRPAWTDYHLLYRDRLGDGTMSPWTEVVPAIERKPVHALWNPGKRERKAIIDIVRTLTREIQSGRVDLSSEGFPFGGKTAQHLPETMFTSLAYLALLHVVSRIPRLGTASETQFLVMQTDAAESGEPEVLILSAFHSL